MKFTKTMATALANRASRMLAAERAKKIKEFTLSEEESKDVMDSINAYFEAKVVFNAASKRMRRGFTYLYLDTDNNSPEQIFNKIVNAIAEDTVPKCNPKIEDLIDDFLIESLDTENADQLIEKVISKYSK